MSNNETTMTMNADVDQFTKAMNDVAKTLQLVMSTMENMSKGVVTTEKKAKSFTSAWKRLSAESKASEEAFRKNAFNLERYMRFFKKLKKPTIGQTLAVKNLQKAMQDSAKRVNKSTRDFTKFRKEVERNKGAEDKLTRSTEEMNKRLDQTKTVAKFAGNALLKMPLKAAGKGFLGAAKSALGLNAALRAISRTGGNLGDMLGALGDKLGDAFKQFAKDSVKLFSDLDTSARKTIVFAGIDQTVENIQELQTTFTDLASVSLFSSNEIARAFEEIASIGNFIDTPLATAEEQLKAVGEAMVGLATATGTANIATVGENLLQISNAFGIGLENVGAVADLVALVANETALSVSEIGFAFQRVSGLATTLGLTLEDTSALLGQLSNMGVAASVAGTTLASAFREMANPSQDAAKWMEALNVEFFNIDGTMKDMATEIIPALNSAFDDLNPEERARALTAMFGAKGGEAIAKLMEGSTGLIALTEQFNELSDVQGTVATGAQFMMGGIEGSIQALRGTFDALKVSLGGALAPAIQDIAKILTNLFESESFKEFIALVGNLASEFLTLLIPILKDAITIFTGFFNTIFENEQLMSDIRDLFATLGRIINLLLPVILRLAGVFINSLLPVILQLASVLEELVETVLVENGKAFAEFMNLISVLVQLIAMLLIPVISELGEVLAFLIPIVIELGNTILKWLVDTIVTAMELISVLAWTVSALDPLDKEKLAVATAIHNATKEAQLLNQALEMGITNFDKFESSFDETLFDDIINQEDPFGFGGQEIPFSPPEGGAFVFPDDAIDDMGDKITDALIQSWVDFANEIKGTSVSDIIDFESLGIIAGLDTGEEVADDITIENLNITIVDDDEADPEGLGEQIGIGIINARRNRGSDAFRQV